MIEDLTASAEMLVFASKLEQFGELIKPNTVIRLNVRVSVREDEAPRLILNSACPPDDAGAAAEKTKTGAVYIRLKSRASPLFERVKALLEIFEGGTPVNFYFEDTKTQLRVPRQLYVNPTQVFLNEVTEIVGMDNVVAK